MSNTKAQLTRSSVEPATAETVRYSVKLRSVGNPDFAQYAPVSNPQTVICDTLEQVCEECRRYISFWNLGSGNWPHTIVYQGETPVAEVSYNGRLWKVGKVGKAEVEVATPTISTEVMQIRLGSGETGRIWEIKLGLLGWAHPNGSQGTAASFRAAEDELNSADIVTDPEDADDEDELLATVAELKGRLRHLQLVADDIMRALGIQGDSEDTSDTANRCLEAIAKLKAPILTSADDSVRVKLPNGSYVDVHAQHNAQIPQVFIHLAKDTVAGSTVVATSPTIATVIVHGDEPGKDARCHLSMWWRDNGPCALFAKLNSVGPNRDTIKEARMHFWK